MDYWTDFPDGVLNCSAASTISLVIAQFHYRGSPRPWVTEIRCTSGFQA